MISRKEYASIESAAVDTNRTMYLRIVRAHAGPQVWSAYLPALRGEHPRVWAGAELIADGPLPASSSRVQIVSREAGQDLLFGRRFAWEFEGADYIAFLSGDRHDVSIVIIDSEWPEKPIWFALPDPAIAWITPNAIGHVVLTPVTVALDVVCLPIYAITVVLMATGVIHGH